jgi:hypothetical protein
MTADDLALEVGKSPKTVRAWLRENFPRPAHEKNKPWNVTVAMQQAARSRWK